MSDIEKLIDGYKKKRGEETENASSGKKEETLKKLRQLQEEFDGQTLARDKKLELERVSYEAPTDDELLAEARRSLENKYSSAKKSAEENAKGKKEKLSELISSAEKDLESKKAALDENYAEAKREAENSALKRGIARSSIAHNSVVGLARALADKKSLSEDETAKEREKLNAQMKLVDDALASTLGELDDAQEKAVADAFGKLKKESEDKALEALKYNNSLEEKEKNFANKTYGVRTQEELDKIKKEYDAKKLSVALDYYLSIGDKAKAFTEFAEDEEMKDLLGEYYDYALAILKNRAK